MRFSRLIRAENPPHPIPNINSSQPNPAQNPRETERDAVAAVHDELETDEHARENTHDEDRGGPRSPCHGAEEADEGKD